MTGTSIENSIQSSLALGLQFADLGTLPGTLERERATDDLILGIDVFDTDGKPLYSTDRLRATRNVPAAWLAAARQARRCRLVRQGAAPNRPPASRSRTISACVIGYLALRYSEERGQRARTMRWRANWRSPRSACSSPLRRWRRSPCWRSCTASSRDLAAVEAALRSADPMRPSERRTRGPVRPRTAALRRAARAAPRRRSRCCAPISSGAPSDEPVAICAASTCAWPAS